VLHWLNVLHDDFFFFFLCSRLYARLRVGTVAKVRKSPSPELAPRVDLTVNTTDICGEEGSPAVELLVIASRLDDGDGLVSTCDSITNCANLPYVYWQSLRSTLMQEPHLGFPSSHFHPISRCPPPVSRGRIRTLTLRKRHTSHLPGTTI
jgi:hypothetical protein